MSTQSRHPGLHSPASFKPFAIALVVGLLIVAGYALMRDTAPAPDMSGLRELDQSLRERADELRTLVERGEMPREALRAIQPDQTFSWDLNGDGRTTDAIVVRFDVDGDGTRDPVSERELEDEFVRRAAGL
ncbi:MAG: hypothetical protein ACRDKZ_09945 [Actinomycetota bacterium]